MSFLNKLTSNVAIGLFLGLILSKLSLYIINNSNTDNVMFHSFVKHPILYTISLCGLVMVLSFFSESLSKTKIKSHSK